MVARQYGMAYNILVVRARPKFDVYVGSVVFAHKLFLNTQVNLLNQNRNIKGKYSNACVRQM